MQFNLEECSYRTCSIDLGLKLKELALRIESHPDRPRGLELEVFASRLLRTIASGFLEKTSSDDIYCLVESAFDLLRDEPQDVSIVQILGMDPQKSVLLLHCDDAFFLVDTVQQYLKELDLGFQILGHPIFFTRRSEDAFAFDDVPGQGRAESLILVETEAVSPVAMEGLISELSQRLEDALKAFRAQPRIQEIISDLASRAETENLRALLSWLNQDNFWIFSYRAIDFYLEGNSAVVSEGPLGLVLDDEQPLWQGEATHAELPDHFRQRLLRVPRVLVESIDLRSRVLNGERLTQIALRETLANGARREHLFFGLFSEKAIDEPTLSVPVLRERIDAALDSLSIPRGCHDYRKAVEIFNTFPKVELFFMDAQTLQDTARSFAYLYRSGSVKVIFTRSLSLQGLTLLLIMPREFYNSEDFKRIEAHLLRFFKAPLAVSRIVNITGSYLSLHVRLTPQDQDASFDLERLEKGLTGLVRPWSQRLKAVLQSHYGPENGKKISEKYADAFSREYRTFLHPRFAVRDIRELEQLIDSRKERFALWGPFKGREKFYRLQFYSTMESSLNDLMPILVNMNLCVLDEVDFSVRLKDKTLYIKSFALRGAGDVDLNLIKHKANLLEALNALYSGELENDYLNRLLVLTGLNWRQIDVFRGYRNYYFQLGSPFTKKRVAYALIHNPQVAVLLYRYFEARFSSELRCSDSIEREELYLSPLRLELASALESVSDINEDRILRTLFNLIDSTVRTNYFIRCNRPDYFFSFKISAIGIMDMPAPRPMYEIYVHSNSMEGIHLRGGKVARGGIRWSDRPDDFRTEILGLMKTQMTKNSLIVPVGSKGGFIVKTPYKTREQGGELSKEAYKTLMRGLLDLTDNRIKGEVCPAEGIVAYDEPDPYLVVAADKGTAHLPDTANSVSAEYDFWLGDSFASGGSSGGYDHKKLGITARGAWESVKRNFREMDHDTQTQPFSVVGIGDMSGDVFGNGMLLSRQIRLMAAFDHRHIFLDPDPDPEASYVERERIFKLPRSSWEDYNPSLISSGGGVYSRTSKDIPLSAEIRQWLGTRSSSLDGEGLIRLLLCAPVDLLWNGGIGTYVKSGSETDDDVGDRSNDAVRIDSSELRARVIAEGGNLGLTQRGRIEYALAGGRINTDAVDNSAGVDTSDHEVNLKIFMGLLQEAGTINSLEQRNSILGTFTDEVCASVLKNNYTQSQCISLDQLRSQKDVEPLLDLADRLSHAGLLDRKGESLPSRKEILSRSDWSFARPELAILMSYAKMNLYQALLASSLPRQQAVEQLYLAYFPTPIRKQYATKLANHPLALEITATVVTNRIVDQAGAAFLNQFTQNTGLSLVEGATAYLCFDLLLRGDLIREQVAQLDNRIASQKQYEILLKLEESIRSLCYWSFDLELTPSLDSSYLDQLSEGLKAFEGSVFEVTQSTGDDFAEIQTLGISSDVIDRLKRLEQYQDFLPLLILSQETGCDFLRAREMLSDVRKMLVAQELSGLIDQVPLHNGWDRKAGESLQGAIAKSCFLIARQILREHEGLAGSFWSDHSKTTKLYKRTLQKVRGTNHLNLHPFMILVRILEGLQS